MKYRKLMMRGAVGVLPVVGIILGGSITASVAAPQVIELMQVPCQFLDVENDQGYLSQSKADCEAINLKSAKERVASSKVLTLKPGDYIFRVSNKNVPYELGFWLREEDYNWANPLHKLNKISVSGGGLVTGATKDYKVTLKPGDYLFSCPLNTTPDYKLVVKDN
ncbi:hypothetical protein [Sneathiella sp.]|jgi:hypothetical protein|uniref:hypothetical protein n=1 Tax=Sneathiella sp. TaxID=1964365 RepID=UPI0039E6A473